MGRITIFLIIALFPVKGLGSDLDSLQHLYAIATGAQEKYAQGHTLAKAYAKNNELQAATKVLEEILQNPEFQNTSSVRVQALLELSDILTNQSKYLQSDSLLTVALRASPDRKQKILIFHSKANNAQRRADMHSLAKHLKSMRSFMGKDTMGLDMARYQHKLGALKINRGDDYIGALDCYLKARQLVPEEELNLRLSLNQNIANIYLAIDEAEAALRYALQNEQLAKVNGKWEGQLFNLYTIIDCYEYLDNNELAIATGRRAIELRARTGVSNAFGFIYSVMAGVFLEMEQLDSALFYVNKGIEISIEQDENKELVDNYNVKARLLLKKKEFKQAEYYAFEAKAMRPYFDLTNGEILVEIYQEQGKIAEAQTILLENYQYLKKRDAENNDHQILEKMINQQFEQEQQRSELIFRQKLDQQRWLGILLFLTLGIIGLIYYLYIKTRNNRALNQLNKELEQKNQDLFQFNYITSHDLKEPVRNIKSFTDLLKRELYSSNGSINKEQTSKYISFIDQGVGTLIRIIDSLKIYTSISNNAFEPVEVDLPLVLQQLEGKFSDKWARSGSKLEIRNPKNINRVLLSERFLLLVLGNLVENGLKYNKAEQPEVTITIEQVADKAHFKIEDNGVGIEKAYQELIFQPFKTLTNKSLTLSSGLGLTICKNILQKIGEPMSVESNGQNGSIFSFSLPIAQAGL